MKTFLSDDQIRFLEAADITDRVPTVCDHERCHDQFHHFAIEVATALATYEVRGDQMAAIVMDQTRALRTLVLSDPDLAGSMALHTYINKAISLAALAYRQFKDSQPDA